MKKILCLCLIGTMAIGLGACGTKSTDEISVDKAESVTQMESSKNEENMDLEDDSATLTYDLLTDIQNGLLYSNEDGKITDKNGNAIKEYDYIKVLDNGSLQDVTDETVIEFCYSGGGGKILYSPPEDNNNDEDIAVGQLPQTYEENCETGTYTNDAGYRYLYDDGNYFDEVVSGAWFDNNGDPISDAFPDNLDNVFVRSGLIVAGPSKYHFVDGTNYTIDDLRREKFASTDDIDPTVFALLISNLQKEEDTDGSIYFVGYEYTSSQPVVVHGNFSGIVNGDNVLMFGIYTGLGADDTPNFQGYYMEIDNGRFY